jgi:hypothetical protein
VSQPASKKDEKYWAVLNAAVSLDIRFGHQKWAMTQLSRQSKVSRTLIYYYFGKSKLGILREAVNLFGAEFAGETPERLAMWKEGRIAESILKSRALLGLIPPLIPFYLLNRELDNELGDAIRLKEKFFKTKLLSFFPHLTADQVNGFFAGFWGAVFAPGLTPGGVQNCVDILVNSAAKK